MHIKSVASLGVMVAVVFIAIGFAGTGSWAGLSDGLVGYYQFENNANDSSNSHNDGTSTNVTFGAGVIGNAAYFNGTNSLIQLQNQPIVGDQEAFTISLFAKKTGDGAGGWNQLLRTASPGTSSGYSLYWFNGNGQTDNISFLFGGKPKSYKYYFSATDNTW
jgi:hypothetical protein